MNKYGENTTVVWSDRKRMLGMPISFTKYSLIESPEWTKIFVKTGVLSTTIDEVNLYRVFDIKITQSFSQKIFGVGTIVVYSNDLNSPETEILNVKNPYVVRNMLAERIEQARDEKGVRVGEIY